ncbi:MAG: IS1595 family transposase, partial [Phycisphaerae bacterium]
MAVTYNINLINLIQKFHSEDKCRAYLQALRWPKGVACPRCKGTKISRIHDRDQFDCDSCRYQFSVTSGTIMHDTHLPLWKWFLAVYMMVESKKGISANQLRRSLEVSYRTAWYLCHRIRHALQTPGALLRGVVEVDETYVGPRKPRYKGTSKHGRGTSKQLVVGAVTRGGETRLRVEQGADRTTLRQFIMDHVCNGADAIYTDENPAYGDLSDADTKHETVKHSAKEW